MIGGSIPNGWWNGAAVCLLVAMAVGPALVGLHPVLATDIGTQLEQLMTQLDTIGQFLDTVVSFLENGLDGL